MSEKGTVKWFSDQKGYGFIKKPDGTDVFLHHSAIDDGSKPLKEGDLVEFEIGAPGGKGPAAKNVRKAMCQYPGK